MIGAFLESLWLLVVSCAILSCAIHCTTDFQSVENFDGLEVRRTFRCGFVVFGLWDKSSDGSST
jgi:hypothetical protein